MPVTDLHPSYSLHAKEWKRTEAAAIGSPALKLNNAEFLPQEYALTEVERYRAFCLRAYYVNLTGRTEKVLQGMVFRKDARFKVPSSMDMYLEDMDGNGESITQLAKAGLVQRLRKDRFIYLADFPSQQSGLTEAEEMAAGVRPICSTYSADNLINWRWGSVAGKKQLELAVLREEINASDDEFGYVAKIQYRVLRLNNGIYTQQVYGEDNQPITEEFSPLMNGSVPFDHIPIHGVRELEVAALHPVAEVNLAYYRNTASLEDMLDVVSTPVLHIDVGETTIQEWNDNNSGTVKVGVRSGLKTKRGKVEFVQAHERPLVRAAREDKFLELAAIGASIVSQGGQAETAEAARIRAGSATSQLNGVVGDLSEDLEGVLEDMALFTGADGDVEYMLNTEFFDVGMLATDLDAIIRGKILYGDKAALHMIREGKIELPSDSTDDELLEDAANLTDDLS